LCVTTEGWLSSISFLFLVAQTSISFAAPEGGAPSGVGASLLFGFEEAEPMVAGMLGVLGGTRRSSAATFCAWSVPSSGMTVGSTGL